MPILQKRINKETYGEVLEKVSSRLAGWKCQTLSLAGRITLTKAVLSSIPVHTMSSILLPASTLDSLDKLSRTFLWGGTTEKKKLHLLAWKKVCKPRGEGGLGIRKSREMNKTLLAKVGWRLLSDDKSLWARVVRSKYKVGDVHDYTWVVPKGSWSSTWRSVGVGLRDVVARGLRWVPGDGRLIRFWSDRWILEEPLLNWATSPLPNEVMNKKLEDYWIVGVGWDVSQLGPYLPENIMKRLYAVVIKGCPGLGDRLSWSGTSDGRFTVKFAYAILTHDATPRPDMERFFKQVWSVVAQERIRVFLWLTGHQAIMTNVERVRRHMGESDVCQVCRGAVETTIHVLRDCPAMSGIWLRVVPQYRRRVFFEQSLLEWLFDNLRERSRPGEENWTTLFSCAVWWAWKWRCGNVFGEQGKCRDRVRFVKELAEETVRSHSLVQGGTRSEIPIEQIISWKRPREGWVKISTDGASHGNPGPATAGGVIRGFDGEWLGGFALNIGICSAPLAELWGVYYGLVIAWERGFRRVELEVDSKLVVGFLHAGISDGHPLSFLVRLCQGFISRDWLVRVTHVYREANRLADGLANYAFSLDLGFLCLDSCPDSVHSILLDDINGIGVSRFVHL
ncbi:Ribonuclease H domain [Arabidopsis thaliana x Arabidopsis arenosa]|uniref:Ribonuclease H domain n=1 Tax=Arabidopsis thaliana x Arabidopsis arenosa TaxID=1240361 RepID=A0A8T2BE16_9BRAS|nr:Ribonuclease H domain [Arabidopsis thaliana x Arabidopsis arenosa]